MSRLKMKNEAFAFCKAHGAGNDFIIIDLLESVGAWSKVSHRADVVRRLCDRNRGIGADGALFLEVNSNPHAAVKWDFYNSDGSFAEMCGNAARCVGLYLAQKSDNPVSFETAAGIVRSQIVGDNRVAVHLDFVRLQSTEIRFESGAGGEGKAWLINSGVPHIVVEVADLEAAKPQTDLIHHLRYHPASGPRGANVTFLQRVPSGPFKTITFERGVEGFTLACGTGVVAAALVAARGELEASVNLQAPGGVFKVDFAKQAPGVVLTGPAQIVFQGFLKPGFLNEEF